LQVATFTKATVYVHTKSPVCYTHAHFTSQKTAKLAQSFVLLIKTAYSTRQLSMVTYKSRQSNSLSNRLNH